MASGLKGFWNGCLVFLAVFLGLPHYSVIANAAPAAPVLNAPVGDVSTASPQFIWQDQADVTQYRLRLHDRALRQRIHVQNYNREDICSNGICMVQPDVVFGFSSDHAWYVRSLNALVVAGSSPHSIIEILRRLQ